VKTLIIEARIPYHSNSYALCSYLQEIYKFHDVMVEYNN